MCLFPASFAIKKNICLWNYGIFDFLKCSILSVISTFFMFGDCLHFRRFSVFLLNYHNCLCVCFFLWFVVFKMFREWLWFSKMFLFVHIVVICSCSAFSVCLNVLWVSYSVLLCVRCSFMIIFFWFCLKELIHCLICSLIFYNFLFVVQDFLQVLYFSLLFFVCHNCLWASSLYAISIFFCMCLHFLWFSSWFIFCDSLLFLFYVIVFIFFFSVNVFIFCIYLFVHCFLRLCSLFDCASVIVFIFFIFYDFLHVIHFLLFSIFYDFLIVLIVNVCHVQFLCDSICLFICLRFSWIYTICVMFFISICLLWLSHFLFYMIFLTILEVLWLSSLSSFCMLWLIITVYALWFSEFSWFSVTLLFYCLWFALFP